MRCRGSELAASDQQHYVHGGNVDSVERRPLSHVRRQGRPPRNRSARSHRAFGIGTVLALILGLLPVFAITPTAHAAADDVTYVDAASTAGNRTAHVVRIPTSIRAGDALVLYLTTNSTTSTFNDTLAGWTLLKSRTGNGVRGAVWTKTAVAADVGSNVTVTTAALHKSVIGVAAYRSTGAVAVSASAVGGI